MAMNDAVDWARELGGGVRVGLIQAGTFRSDAGTLFGPVPWVLWGGLVEDEVDDKRRLLQALNCLLIGARLGRVLVRPGSATASTTRLARCVAMKGRGSCPPSKRPASPRRASTSSP